MIPVVFLSRDPQRRAQLWSPRIEETMQHLGFCWTEDLAEARALVTTWGSPRLEKPLLEKMPQLQIIGHAAGSVQPIVTPELFAGGIPLLSANGLLAETVAEWSIMATLMMQRRIGKYAKLRAGEAAYWGRFHSFRDIHDTVIGIWGFGDIARAYLKRMRPFDAKKLLVFSRHAPEREIAAWGAEKTDSFETLLRECDQLHCLTGQTPQNLGMLNAEKLSLLHDDAEVINCGRPGLMDYDALYQECRKGRLCAMLDVLPGDPRQSGLKLEDLPNVIITPHTAGASGRTRYIPWLFEQFARFFAGEPLTEGVVSGQRAENMTREMTK